MYRAILAHTVFVWFRMNVDMSPRPRILIKRALDPRFSHSFLLLAIINIDVYEMLGKVMMIFLVQINLLAMDALLIQYLM